MRPTTTVIPALSLALVLAACAGGTSSDAAPVDARHDVTIENVGTVADASGGSQDLGEVTLEPGTYTVFCSLPGHRQAGMEYEVTVQA